MGLLHSNACCKHCGKPRARHGQSQQQQQQIQNMVIEMLDCGRRGAVSLFESLAQAVTKLPQPSQGGGRTAAGCGHHNKRARNPLESFLATHLQSLWWKPNNIGMLVPPKQPALAAIVDSPAAAAADGSSQGFGTTRPVWVKNPSSSALALAEEIAQSAAVGWSGFIRPVDKTWEISSGFGPRWGKHHNGVDLAAPTGEPVLAADAGQVTYAGWEPGGYGYLVEITHRDGWKTLYAHNSEIFTWEGQQVRRGQCIASVGETGRATGPHLHWEIRNKFGHPVDPSEYVTL